jgi:hypothetical protein
MRAVTVLYQGIERLASRDHQLISPEETTRGAFAQVPIADLEGRSIESTLRPAGGSVWSFVHRHPS